MPAPRATFTLDLVNRTAAGFKSFDASLASSQRKLKGFAAAGAAAFAGISAAAVGTTTSIARIGDVSDRLGVSTQKFQELAIAAEAVGVSQSNFEQGLQRLTRRSADAIAGNQGLIDAFNALGVSVDDLSDMTADEAFFALADGMQDLEGAGTQLLQFFKLFDVEGTDLIRVARKMNEEGFKAAIEGAKELGAVIDDEVIRAAQDTRTNLVLLEKSIGGTFKTALAGAGTVLGDLAEDLATLAVNAARALGILEKPRVQRLAEIQAQLKQVEQRIYDLQSEAARGPGIFDALGGLVGAESTTEKLAEQVDLRRQLLAEQQQLNAEAKAAADAEETAGTPLGESAETQDPEAKPPELTQAEREAALMAARIMERRETEETLTQIEKEEAEKRHQIDLAQARSKQQLTRALGAAAMDTARVLGLSEKAMKPIRIAAAIADTYAGANRALREHSAPASYAIAASIVAAGLANVKAMATSSTSGGGSAAVGVASSVPGEQTQRQMFNVEFRSGAGFFDESSLRRLFDALQEVSEDGTANLSGRFIVQGI